ncbi:Protein CLT1, chloroplastic [Glycine soja]|uniref:Protein CLT1, chloroplastic n=1 Tax=Glycine soja TaxID=3848 RepID=A0A445F0Q5_GLYSO|nr:Protein CLT1, chloroplastic [Glycine soja]
MTSLCRRIPVAGTGQLRLRCAPRTAAIGEVHYGCSPKWPTITLRLPPPVKCGGAWKRSGEKKAAVAAPRPCAVGRLAAESGRESGNRSAEVVLAAAVTVVMGAGNRVLYKLALVPLKNYPFFLAQLATFGYVIVYFSILYMRYRAGIVTDEMLSVPKTPFLVVGLLEALGAATGMAAGAMLSGASIPILSQAFLVWQILLSYIFLGRRYKVNQLVGCFLVAIGVILTVASGSGAGHSLKEAGIFWSLLMIVSFLFQAADTVLKEVIFLDATRKLKGGSLDMFVVNSFGSAFQALFICLLLPFLSKLWGVPFGQLPNYLKDGAACFLNVGTLSRGKQLYFLFHIVISYRRQYPKSGFCPPSAAVGRCHLRPFFPARPGLGSPRKVRPTPGSRAANGASTRRPYLARFLAREAHSPPSRRQKLTCLVLAASSLAPELVSGLTSRFR